MKKTMKKCWAMYLLFAIAVGLFCSCDKSSNYLSVIPKDSVAAIKINIGQLLNKSEVLEMKAVKDLAELGASQADASIESQRLLKAILKDPNASGLDVNQPMVAVFEGLNMKGLLTFAVSDKDALINTLETLKKEFENIGVLFDFEENEKGYTSINEFDPYGSIYGNIAAFDESKLVFAIAEKNPDVVPYMELEYEDQALSDSRFQAFVNAQKDLSIYYDLSILSEIMPLLQAQMPELNMGGYLEMMEGATGLVSLDFQQGKAVIDYEMINPSDELKAYYKQFVKKPSKKLLAYVPENSYLVANMGLQNLSKCFDYIPEATTMFNEIGLKAEWLNDLNGDFTFAISQSALTDEPLLMFAAQCEDGELINFFKKLLQQEAGLMQVAEQVYAIEGVSNKMPYYAGYKEGVMFFMPGSIYEQCVDGNKLAKLNNNFSKTSLASMLNNSGMVIDLNLASVDIKKALEDSYMSQDDRMLLACLNSFESLTASYENDNLEGEVVLNFNDKKNNSLKAVIQLIMNIAGSNL